MKSYILIVISYHLIFSFLNAQICEIDSAILNQSSTLFPPPYHAESNPMGGIRDTACVGIPFEYHFSVRPAFGAVDAALVSFQIRHTNFEPPLPSFNHVCDQYECVYEPQQLGCMKIYGTPQIADIGQHELTFQVTDTWFYNGDEVNAHANIPNPAGSSGVPYGAYTLVVEESNSAYCTLVQTHEEAQIEFSDIYNYPNPFNAYTEIRFPSFTGKIKMSVLNASGAIIYSNTYSLNNESQLLFKRPGSMSSGFYFYILESEKFFYSGKMIVSN